MKVMTVLGTRPEIIRLSSLIPLLDDNCHHVLVHTGQNYDESLDQIFFRDLEVRLPDVNLESRGPFGSQVGSILRGVEELFYKHRPERLLVLGDTNSGLAALVAKRLGIAVFHMEAGNRCYDDRVPEETNRRVIDHCSSVLLPYTNRSRENLLREGIGGERIYVTGNPIKQILDRWEDRIVSSNVLTHLHLTRKEFFLVTMHRAENVDSPQRLSKILDALTKIASEYHFPVVCSVHPRTASRISQFGIEGRRTGVRLLKPMPFFDFVSLEKSAFCCLSDSGTVQEEACIFGVPNVTLRDVTERPETVECGSNFVAGTEVTGIVDAVKVVTSLASAWLPPREYLAPNVAETCARVLLSSRLSDLAEAEWRANTREP